MRRARIVNRALWGLLATSVVAVAAWAAVVVVRIYAPADPLPVPRLSLTTIPADLALADVPERNPFDPTGAPWVPVAAKPAAPTGTLQGVVILPGKRGVMTSSGFVPTGADFDGGKLKRVERTRVIVEEPSGERVIPVGEDHSKMLAEWFAPGAAGKSQGRAPR